MSNEGRAPMSIVFALLGAFSQALTSVLQRLANVAGSEVKRSAWQTTLFLVRQPMWLLGMVIDGQARSSSLRWPSTSASWPPSSPSWSPSSSSRSPCGRSGSATASPPAPGERQHCCVPACSGSWSWPTPRRATGIPSAAQLGRGGGLPLAGGRAAGHPQPLGVPGPSRRDARVPPPHWCGPSTPPSSSRPPRSWPASGWSGLVPALAALRGGGHRGARHRAARVGLRRRSAGRLAVRAARSSIPWPASPWASSCSASSSGRRRSPSPSRPCSSSGCSPGWSCCPGGPHRRWRPGGAVGARSRPAEWRPPRRRDPHPDRPEPRPSPWADQVTGWSPSSRWPCAQMAACDCIRPGPRLMPWPRRYGSASAVHPTVSTDPEALAARRPGPWIPAVGPGDRRRRPARPGVVGVG